MSNKTGKLVKTSGFDYRNVGVSIQNYMACLSTEQLMSLHSDLVLAGIAFDGKGDYRSIFASGRKNSTGKLKKIYAALYQAKKENINDMVRTLVELLPQGIKTNEHNRKSAS